MTRPTHQKRPAPWGFSFSFYPGSVGEMPADGEITAGSGKSERHAASPLGPGEVSLSLPRAGALSWHQDAPGSTFDPSEAP